MLDVDLTKHGSDCQGPEWLLGEEPEVPRLLPWTHEGKPCYLPSGGGWLPALSQVELPLLVRHLCKTLMDVLCVADSRGARVVRAQ